MCPHSSLPLIRRFSVKAAPAVVFVSPLVIRHMALDTSHFRSLPTGSQHASVHMVVVTDQQYTKSHPGGNSLFWEFLHANWTELELALGNPADGNSQMCARLLPGGTAERKQNILDNDVR